MAGPAVTPDLYTFLEGAELAHYYDGLRRDLKVTSVPQLKYVDDDDLSDLGMTRPEMRRLKKFYRRECPQGTFSKLRKMLKGTDASSPPPGPDKPSGPPVSTAPGKHVIPEEAITVLKTLGTGEFGTVQQGVWTTDAGQRVQVAIKRLLKEKLQSGMPDFLSEATIMHSLDHEHVVRLYGVVIGADALMLVTELAPLRSLLECLREPSFRPSFPVTQLCEVSRQVAAGMAYLEDNRFIHRDLAARNILVFRKDTVKISDFGLSRALGVGKDYYQTNFNVNLKLPLAWCAPECINFLRFTSASDVWAYGVTLWELFSYGFQPWAGFTGHQVHQAIDEPSCQRLEQPDLCPTPYYQLMTNCWQHQADKRPKFADIVTQLPLIKPDQVQVIRDTPTSPAKDHLPLRATDIVTVLDKSCPDVPSPGMWKGVNNDGKVGYFDRVNVAPFIDVKTSPAHRKAKITRKESGRKSSRSLKPKLQPKIQPKLHVGLIGRPEGDLRHTGHIGYDGAMFGDVAFIGEQYEKLPVKVGTPTHMNNAGSASSLSNIGDGDNYSQADSLMTSSMISVESHDDTLTDVSSMCDLDAVSVSRSQETLDRYEEINDDDLDNFRVPDLGLGADLDLGPSFLEEVMKALSTKESPSAHSKPINETSPLIERDQPFRQGRTTFDNVAMVTENDSNGTTDTDNQDSGDVKSSLMSPESDGRDAEAGQKDEKKRKNKLKLFIPNRDKKERMRTLSASDEKRIDDAIELANEFAQMQTSDHMVSSPRASLASAEPDTGSPQTARASSGFMSLRKSKSPKVEKKSFTEEMASMASSENLLTPEAQEAYNLLVVKGSLKEKVGKDRRQRRSLDQESSRRPVNQNIRDPQGIPGRVASPRGDEQDTNPLRRLRDSAFIPKSRLPKSAGSGDSNGWGSRKQSKTEDPELNANLSFFAKLKEQETEVATATSPTTNGTSNGVTNGELIVDVSVSSNNSVCGTSSSPQLPTPPRSKHGTNRILPVPPRVPLKPSTLNQKPRQRKYPLDLSSYSHHLPVSSTSSAGDRGSYSSEGSSGLGTSPRGTTDALNTTHESDDSVFNHTDSSRNVTLSASELGYYDTTDTFWSKTVDFDELSAGRDPSVSREASPIPGRYKTSDNVSYEDLMEFALDGPIIPTREPDDPICDEVRLMRRILSKEVTTESCMYALEETRWDVHAAVKLLKLKQLLGADLGDSAACKRALMAAHWSVEEAANYLLKHPPNQTSPDLVHV